MDRLTATQKYGYAVCPENVPAALDRLGEYEDTGLEPQEIATLRADLEANQARLAEIQRSARNARNELCQRCGKYRESHNGACDGCKWKE